MGAKFFILCGRSLFIASAFLLIAGLYPSSGFAYRPFVTEDAGVAGKGVMQLETSWDYLSWRNGDREHGLLLVPIYGLTERLELSAEVPYLFHHPQHEPDESGIGDVNFVAKYLLFQEKDMLPAFALKGAIKTNTGDSATGLGSGDLDYSLVAVASKTLGPVTFHSMFGYTFIGTNGDDNVGDIYLWGVAADYALTEKFHLVAEVTGNRHQDRRAADDPASGLVGLTYKISEKVTVDGGMRFGFNDAAPEWNSTVGITVTF